MSALNNDRLPITKLGIGMARDDFIDGEFCTARSKLELLQIWNSNSKVANLDIGKSREDAIHSHSDTQAWAKQMSTTYWKAKRTTTRLVP